MHFVSNPVMVYTAKGENYIKITTSGQTSYSCYGAASRDTSLMISMVFDKTGV